MGSSFNSPQGTFLLYSVKVELKVHCSLPVPLLDIPPAEQRIIHRIMYRTLPAVVRGADPSPVPTALKFEIALGLSNTKPTSTGDVTQGVEASQQNPSVTGTIDLSPKCWVGPETRLNLMIPDRFVYATHSFASLITPFTVPWIFALPGLIVYH
jgi:hypothetical protein